VVKELAQKFELSVDSIRRDLTIMEEQGLLKKFYGGAVPASQVRVFPQLEAIRYGEPDAAHDAISKLAASYIQANDSVFIGGAGIQYGMLRHLPRHFPLTVVTNSLKIAQTIREWENVDAFLIGGKLRASSGGSIIDPLAIEQIRRFSLDLCFITGGGVTAKGVSTATTEGASFARAVSEVSRMKICLAPLEKVGQDMFAHSVPLRELDLIITDEYAPIDWIRQMENAGIKVVSAVANVEENAKGDKR
jgi:DeoR/GlpR family transcriptional regulator of sugar metabolism